MHPLVGRLLNAILVYLALKSQVEANEKIQKRQDEQEIKQEENNKKIEEKFEHQASEETKNKKITQIMEKINFIKTELNNFYFSNAQDINGKGAIGLKLLLCELRITNFIEDPSKFAKIPSAVALEQLVQIFNELLVEIYNENILLTDDKIGLIFQLEFYFNATLKPHFYEKSVAPTQLFDKTEGIPSQLMKQVNQIERKIYDFKAILKNTNNI